MPNKKRVKRHIVTHEWDNFSYTDTLAEADATYLANKKGGRRSRTKIGLKGLKIGFNVKF